MKRAVPGLLLVALLPACSGSEETPSAVADRAPEELVREMYAAVDELKARPEHTESEVTIQHLLVAVAGRGIEGVTRTPAEAEQLTAELFARARADEDFDLLVKNWTNEEHPGIYVLTTGAGDPPRSYARDKMWAGLGDIAWRLQVGELGVAPYDGHFDPLQAKSPLGFHIVKRLK